MKSRTKSIWQVSVTTSLEAEDAVGEFLERMFGQSPVAYTNAETRTAIVSIYGEKRPERTATRRHALNAGLKAIRAIGFSVGPISLRKLAREDWAESWKRHFKVLEISPRLLVKPGWIKRRPRKNQAVVVLDPGLSFGTGNHPTTAFCLHALARREGQGVSFLDIGTGSGILAIAAAKLGYTPVVAMDFDAEAVRTARENARLNGVLGKVRITRSDVAALPLRSRTKFDFICANLALDVLLLHRKRIVGQLRRGGTLVLAGILKGEFSQVRRDYEKTGLKLVRSKVEGEWQSGVFVLGSSTDA